LGSPFNLGLDVNPDLLWNIQETLHDLRIKLGAATARDFIAGILVGECFAIGAIGGHRIEGVDQGKKSSQAKEFGRP
jgi:hypothetical protein